MGDVMSELNPQQESLEQELNALHQLIENSLIADSCTEQQLRLITKELVIATGKMPDEMFEESLEQQAVAYAEEHPAIAQAVKQVIHALGNIGV